MLPENWLPSRPAPLFWLSAAGLLAGALFVLTAAAVAATGVG